MAGHLDKQQEAYPTLEIHTVEKTMSHNYTLKEALGVDWTQWGFSRWGFVAVVGQNRIAAVASSFAMVGFSYIFG